MNVRRSIVVGGLVLAVCAGVRCGVAAERESEKFETGSPLLTILTEGPDPAGCEANLVRLARETRSLFD